MSSNLERQPDSGPEIERYRVLLELADLMVHRPTLPELFHELAQTLRKAISFDFINFSLYDPTTNAMRLRLWEGEGAPLVAARIYRFGGAQPGMPNNFEITILCAPCTHVSGVRRSENGDNQTFQALPPAER